MSQSVFNSLRGHLIATALFHSSFSVGFFPALGAMMSKRSAMLNYSIMPALMIPEGKNSAFNGDPREKFYQKLARHTFAINTVIFSPPLRRGDVPQENFVEFGTACDRRIGNEQNTSGSNKLEFYFTLQFSKQSALNASLTYVGMYLYSFKSVLRPNM